jgi:hypothetical protein
LDPDSKSGPLDMAIKLSIGNVIDGRAGASHQQSAEGEDNQWPKVRETLRCLDKRSPAREKR